MTSSQETNFNAQTNDEKELVEAISAAVIRMHHRDFYAVSDACVKYLGHDTLREQRRTEFEALPQDEKQHMESTKDFGIYGIFALASQPEVPLALRLVAHELFPLSATLKQNDREKLSDPAIITGISARFPEMTTQRIERILAL